jgi:hypothetical protein
MRTWILASTRTLIFTLCVSLLFTAGGCGSSNPNEAEFLREAPPGKPPENPNESFKERKERLLQAAKERDKEFAGKKGSTRSKSKSR